MNVNLRWVPNLEPGWIRVKQGEERWVTSQGKESVAEHATNVLSGESISIREMQNRQKANRVAQGEELQAVVPRQGKLKTTRKGWSDIHGNYQTQTFRSLIEAEQWVLLHSHDPFTKMMIQLRFKQSAIPGKNYPAQYNEEGKRTGYENFASLTHFFDLSNDQDILRGFQAAVANDVNFIKDDRSRYVIQYIER